MARAQSVTFYKRTLPSPPATEFSSPKGVALFQEALREGTMVGFFKLIEQYRTQTEPAFCGLTSLAMVLNALAIDPRRTWKAPWRWFDETLLDCCKALDLVQEEGLSLMQATCLARCNGAQATMRHFGAFNLGEFRHLITDCCRSGEKHLIVSYARGTLSQTGSGHFSPIGGYHAGEDNVLILDTARFKYPPHWVPLELLYEAMRQQDEATQKPRGYILLQAPEQHVSVYYTLNRSERSWTQAVTFVRSQAPQIFRQRAEVGEDLQDILRHLLEVCPVESVQKFIARRVSSCTCTSDVEAKAEAQLTALAIQFMKEFQTLALYQEVAKCMDGGKPHDADLVGRVTALLLLEPVAVWCDGVPRPEIREGLSQWMDLSGCDLVQTEIEFLRRQLGILVDLGELENLATNGNNVII